MEKCPTTPLQRLVEISRLKTAERVLREYDILTDEISSRIQSAITRLMESGGWRTLQIPPADGTTRELTALRVLAAQKGQCVSQQRLLQEIYGTDKLTSSNLRKLRVLIFRVRRKIATAGVITFEMGKGYALYTSETDAGK